MGAKLNDYIIFCHCEMVLLKTDLEKMLDGQIPLSYLSKFSKSKDKKISLVTFL